MNDKEDLIPKSAAVHATRRRAFEAFGLPDEYAISHPMLSVQEGELRVVYFAFIVTRIPGRESLAHPPVKICTVNPFGDECSAKLLRQGDYGIKANEGEPAGKLEYPPGITMDQINEMKVELVSKLAILMDPYAKGGDRNREGVAIHADRCVELYNALFEPPMRSYYISIGKPFFDWLELRE